MNKKFTSNLALGIDAICLIAKLHGKSVDQAQLLHQFQINSDDPIKSDAQMLRASQSIGLKSKFIEFEPNDICNRVLPAICKSKQGGYAILAKVSNSKLLIHDENELPVQQSVSVEEFLAKYDSRILMVAPRQRLLSSTARFGFQWFIPAMMKYQKYFSDVIIASFFIQLLALGSPIFFQVAIDKVMVHKGMTTLDVLAIGFFFIILFEVLLTGLRTYLFSHTTNRVDVELGSRLYHHMTKLPIAFFQVS